VVANALGEVIGLGAVAGGGLSLTIYWGEATGSRAVVGIAATMIVLGAFEGVVLGVAQWLVLHGPLPTLAWHAWVRATLLGAVVAWTLAWCQARSCF
jgi:hypothetical protein